MESSPTATGRTAEGLAANFLVARGHRILDRNWRNRWCELDIVTQHASRVHFVEVKYRRTADFGAPAEFVRHDKIARLARAAGAWSQAHAYAGPYQIDVIAVTGPLTAPTIELIDNALG